MSEAKRKSRFDTMDLVTVAIVGAVGGVFTTAGGVIYWPLVGALGPLGAAIAGYYNWFGIVAVYLRRKLLICFITVAVIAGMVTWLTGNPSGIYVFGWMILNGIGQEIPFAVTRYRNYSAPVCFVSGGLGAVLGIFYTAYLFGWGAVPGIEYLVLMFIVSGIMSGLALGYGIAKAIEKSGLVEIPKVPA